MLKEKLRAVVCNFLTGIRLGESLAKKYKKILKYYKNLQKCACFKSKMQRILKYFYQCYDHFSSVNNYLCYLNCQNYKIRKLIFAHFTPFLRRVKLFNADQFLIKYLRKFLSELLQQVTYVLKFCYYNIVIISA